jgi:hypothetical protein
LQSRWIAIAIYNIIIIGACVPLCRFINRVVNLDMATLCGCA